MKVIDQPETGNKTLTYAQQEVAAAQERRRR